MLAIDASSAMCTALVHFSDGRRADSTDPVTKTVSPILSEDQSI